MSDTRVEVPTQKSVPAVQPTAAPVQRPAAATARGLHFDRHFTTPGVSPYDQITWELRDAVIQDWKGKLIFEQKNVESPPTGP